MADRPLSPARQELLRRQLAKRQLYGQLSSAQERFWFLDQLEPGSSEFNITVLARMHGIVRPDAMRHALVELSRRHESLCTVFPSSNGHPRARVVTHSELPFTHTKVRALATDRPRQAELGNFCREQHKQGFNLANGPLWRTTLVELGPSDYALILTLHHIITDGWSMGLLVRDLASLYSSAVGGKPTAPWPKAPSYRQLAHEEVQRLQSGSRLDQLVSFWRSFLADAPPVIDLPHDHPLPAIATHAGRTLRVAFSEGTTANIKQWAKTLDATPYQVLLALFAGFMSRIGGTRDLVIGTSYAGRDRAAASHVTGAFVNTLPLRLQLTDKADLSQLVTTTRTALRAAIAHSALPFEKLVGELAGTRDPRRTPLFNVFFDLAVHHQVPQWDGLEVWEEAFELGESPFEISLSIHAQGPCFAARLQYKTDLFDSETIEGFWAAFEHFTQHLVTSKSCAFDRAPLTPSSTSTDQVISDFYGPEARIPVPSNFCGVHAQIESAARRFPNQVALVDGPCSWTFADLDAESSRLAKSLVDWLGDPPPGTPVCVAIKRSGPAAIATLAVWRAGLCYVPLDPCDPNSRRTRILSQVATGTGSPAKVLTWGDKLELPQGSNRFDLEVWLNDDRPQDPGLPPQHVKSTDACYIIFTSGSTGEPKGVTVPHGALANHIEWARQAFHFQPKDRFLLRTPLSFDASIWELVHPLCAGATIIVAGPETSRDAQALFELAKNERISVLQSVPSILRAWLDEPGFTQLSHLQHLISAGEALPHALVDKVHQCWHKAKIPARLYNLYGPTEACIDALWHELDPTKTGRRHGGRDSVPVGKPIHGAQAVVLDANFEPLPIGVEGELFIGGDGLATGYFGQTKQTKEHFVEIDIGGNKQRWYRSGDRARQLPDGLVEVLGRNDGQVKIRGSRVEVGEIERAMLALDCVRQAVVVPKDTGASGMRLFGFVVFHKGVQASGSIAKLIAHIASSLPLSMQLAAVSTLDELPLTVSEKIDRQALVQMVDGTASIGSGRAPVGPVEVFVAHKLADLLGVEVVDVEANFFALGGHSLLATRLLAAAREHFNCELSLARFLQHPTLASLAKEISSNTSEVTVPARRQDNPIPLSRAQERLWLLAQERPKDTRFNMLGALRIHGDLDIQALEIALTFLIERHAILRTNFRELQPGAPWIAEQVIHPPYDFHITEHNEEGAFNKQLEVEIKRTFNLAQDQLFRLDHFQTGPSESVLLFNMHHILGDGWSLQVLSNELEELYASALQKRPHQLEPLAFDFADFAAFERNSSPNQKSLDAWIEYLSGAPALQSPLELSLDRSRPSHPSHSGAEVSLTLPEAFAQRIRRVSRELETSLHTTLLAMLASLIARTTGEQDLVLGTVIANRTLIGTERLIGFFVSAMPVRIHTNDAPNLGDMVRRTQRAMAFAIEHPEPGLDTLIDALSVQSALRRSPNTAPLFQVGFDYAKDADETPRIGGLPTEVIEVHNQTAKLDLNFRVEDQPDGEMLLRAEFATDLFNANTVQGMLDAWTVLLDQLADNPSTKWASALLLSKEQRDTAIAHAVGPRVPNGSSSALLDFEHHARVHPESVALIDSTEDGRHISYGELNLRAAEIAARLSKLTIPGPVAVDLPRSGGQIAALLGIWKVGRAWLSLDASEPIDRCKRLIQGSRSVAIVTANSRRAKTLGLAYFGPPELDESISECPQRAPGTDDDAYLIATSGTTGEPKWVVMRHAAFAAHNRAAVERYRLSKEDVFLHRIPLTFDAALIEILTPLSIGSRVVLASEETARDPQAIIDLAHRERVSILVGVPSWLEVLFSDHRSAARMDRLRLIACGGEVISSTLRAMWKRLNHRPEIWNAYGPAEACIEATSRRLDELDFEPGSDPPSIGRPHAGTLAIVLDDDGEPVPLGTEGELVLGGICLARGYVGAHAKDESRFRPNHLTGKGQLYWTGDRAKRRGDGQLVFLGRRDRVIKFGGRRLDPNEIERVIESDPLVIKAAVLSRDSGTLVANVAFGPDRPADNKLPQSIFSRCQASLCASFMPTEWRGHAALPQLPSGKTDRSRLEHDTNIGVRLSIAIETTKDALEQQLIRVFEAHLPGASIGRSSDYFAIGGNSLGAIRLVAELTERTGISLRLADFFQASSPGALATKIREGSQPNQSVQPDMQADAQLAPEFVPKHKSRPFERTTILLTGATGFLGAFLLVELARSGLHEVRCLVRAKSATAARRRLDASLRLYGIDLPPDARVRAFPGDLAKVGLGLTSRDRDELISGLTHVIHNGAAVDFFRDYTALRGTNVEGTREVIRLAMLAGAELNLVSTIGVLAGHQHMAHRIDERTPLDLLRSVDGGYEQSKWVAEALTVEAGQRGLPTRIFRPGRISPSAKLSPGSGNSDDFASRFLLGCIEMGLAPQLEASFDVTPVDHVARTIVALVNGNQQPNDTWHLLHPTQTPSGAFFKAAAERGHPTRSVELAEWIEALKISSNERLAPIIALLDNLDEAAIAKQLTPDATLWNVDSSHSHSRLAELGLSPPTIDSRYCHASIRFFENQGELACHAHRPSSYDRKSRGI